MRKWLYAIIYDVRALLRYARLAYGIQLGQRFFKITVQILIFLIGISLQEIFLFN